MAERIAHVRVDDPESGAAIHQAMATLSIPPDLERAIVQACKHLHNSAVAVRSSATVEDLADAAFAGQQDTFLNIVGAAAVLDAVRRCWASQWTDRAIAYRARVGIDPPTVKIAVVVQMLSSLYQL